MKKNKWKLKCQICKNNSNENKNFDKLFVYHKHYKGNNNEHNCILINNDDASEELKNIQDLLNKYGNLVINEQIKIFVNNFTKNDFLYENYINKINELNNNISDFIEQNKEIILEKDINYINYKNGAISAEKNLLEEIKLNFQKNHENLDNWTEYKSIQIIDNKPFLTFTKYTKIISKNIIKLFNLYNFEHDLKLIIKEREPLKILDANNFENYYETDNYEGFLIINENSLFQLKRRNIIFNGCYDFDPKNCIFVVAKNELNLQKYKVYKLAKNNNSEADLHIDVNDEIIKIKIIPFEYDIRKKYGYALFFTKDDIYLIDLDTSELIADLPMDSYDDYNIEDFQFLIYEKFLLIFHFDNSKNIWKCDVFNICLDDTNKFKNMNNTQEFKAPKNCKFSICSKKNEVILYYQYKINNKFYFSGNKIESSLSKVKIDLSLDKEESRHLNFTEGNCIFNYFYHCFIKFPPRSAIEYFYYNKKNFISKIFLNIKDTKMTLHFKEYFDNLKQFVMEEKG